MGKAPGASRTPQGSGPKPILQRIAANWALLLVLAVLVLVGTAANRRAPEEAPTPVPAGWSLASETGASLCLAFDGDTVWVGGKSGLHRVDRATGAYLGKVDLGIPSLHVRSVAIDAQDTLWVGHVDGLAHRVGGRWEHFGEQDGLPNKRVNALLAVQGRVFVGTAEGLAEFDNGRVRDLGVTARLASPVVNVLFQSADGTLWVASNSDPEGGVSRVRGDQIETMRVAQGLPHPYVQCFAEPRPGELWIATGQFDKGGAALLSPAGGALKPRQVLTKRHGLAGEKVRSLGVDAGGRVWFGSESDGLAIETRAGRLTVLTTRDGLPHNEVTAIARDADGTMWLATLAGVVRIEVGAAGTLGEEASDRG